MQLQLNMQEHYSDSPYEIDKSLKWYGPGWYRFLNPAGEKLPESPVDYKMCNTNAPGWMNGSHPTQPGELVDRIVCFTYIDNYCFWQK